MKSVYRFTLDFTAKNTLKGEINGIKVDFITHSYPEVLNPLTIEGVRMASLEDIAAMKLNAIIGSGSRVKDFVDVAYLSCHLSLKKMIQAYTAKYSNNNSIMALKALNFHNDINFKKPVQLLESNFNWDTVVLRLREMTKDPDKIFTSITMADNIDKAPRVKRGR